MNIHLLFLTQAHFQRCNREARH